MMKKPETQISRRLVLIDGHAVLFRAFHAMPEFTSPTGQATGAVYGFVNVLIRVLRELQPTWIVTCFDAPGPTFRDAVYPAYKATRAETPPALIAQEPLVKEALAALAVPSYARPGFEADDLIATFVHQVLDEQKTGNRKQHSDLRHPTSVIRPSSSDVEEVVIVTGDRDLLQLASPRVGFYLLRRGVKDMAVLDLPAVEELLAVPVSQYLDWKALRGDPSDNIPGVPGIGDKTAQALIRHAGTLKKLFALVHAPTEQPFLPPRLRDALCKHESAVHLFRSLLDLKQDVPIQLDLAAARRDRYQPAAARPILERFGFRGILDRLPPAVSTTAVQERLL